MNQFEINQKLLAEAMDLYYRQYKPADAIDKIDAVLRTDKNSFAYSLKATILKNLNRVPEALAVVDEGIGHDLKAHNLLKLKAEILSSSPYFKTQEALVCIQWAQIYFEESDKLLREFIKTLPGYDKSEYLINYLGTKTELKILESDIRNLDTSLIILSRAENLEKQLYGERIRTIELLGVFTAIFAFIFSGVQVFTKLVLPEALVLLTGIALLLISFLLSLHMVLDPQARTRHLIALLVILVLVLFGLPWYAKFLAL